MVTLTHFIASVGGSIVCLVMRGFMMSGTYCIFDVVGSTFSLVFVTILLRRRCMRATLQRERRCLRECSRGMNSCLISKICYVCSLLWW